MEERTSVFIGGSEAYRLIKDHNISISYPTVIKRLKHDGVAKQPAGNGTGILVHRKRLEMWIATECQKRGIA